MLPSSAEITGRKLGKYELVRSLAVGGMAELFLARASGIEGFAKLVVVKRILPNLALNAEFVRMFLDEARLAAQLHHPNIAAVHDIGHDGQSHFFVMEYIHGRDLRALITRARASGGLPLEHALTIVTGVAAGLHHAHEHGDEEGRPLGIVHRDVSPTNVLVSFDGAVKLVDFGVAKARVRQTETRDGTLKGKLAYMSPEQCRGEPVDRRSDVFSLGLILYELTTGQRPYPDENEFSLMNLVAGAQLAPPTKVLPGYPPELEAIVMRALRRDPRERFATAEELQLDLERFASRARLQLSSVALRRTMRALFPEARLARSPTGPAERINTVVMDAELPDETSGSGAPLVLPLDEERPARRSRGRIAAALGALAVAVAVTLLVARDARRSVAITVPKLPVEPPPVVVLPPPPAPPPAPSPEPPAVAPAPVEAAPAPPPQRSAPPKARKKKRPASWDPDSPFLPPEKR